MRAILPGRPQSKRQAVSTAHWDGLRLVAYISGNTAIILRDPKDIVQTISIDHVEGLEAITIDESSGRIAVCNEDRVLVFDAVGRDEGDLRWTQTHDITIPDHGTACSLSWGSSEDLLVGGTELWLYHLPYSDLPRLIWQQPVANEVCMARFSNDAELIASCGQHDKLVKIWRRLSFELDSTRFDVSYLPHPAAVIDLRWRRPWHNEHSLDLLLYTFCADGKVRVWAYSDPHSISVVQLVATIDTNVSIEPRRRSIGSVSRQRYVFILDSRDFSSCTEKAISQSHNQRVDHALEHLIEIANRSPEFCVVFDGQGHMSVWGLENAGCKNRKPTDVFNVTLVDQVDVQLRFPHGMDSDYTSLSVFGGGTRPDALSLLVHSYTGQIDWYESSITHFFDTSPRKDRFKLLSSWSGHTLSIDHIARGSRGNNILSWTDEGQAILWTQTRTGALRRQCIIQASCNVLSVVHFDAAGHSLFLHSDAITLWDVRYAHAVKIAENRIDTGRAPTLIQRIGLADSSLSRIHFAIAFDNGSKEIWQVQLITDDKHSSRLNGGHTFLSKLSQLTGVGDEDCRSVPCDIAVNTQDQNVAHANLEKVYINATGQLQTVSTTLEQHLGTTHMKIASHFETNIEYSSYARVSSSGKCAIVASNKKSLTIWDLEQRVCEWQYESNTDAEIQKLNWGSTLRGNHFLLIGFSHHAVVVGQSRYPVTYTQQSAWYITRNFSLRDFTTFHIGDICWLSSGNLAIGAGNQIFVLENQVTESDSSILKQSQIVIESQSASGVVDMANSILPVFHADFLQALIFQTGFKPAETMLRRFYEKLKYFSEGDELSSNLDLPLKKILDLPDNIVCNGLQVNGDTDHTFELETVEDSFLEYLDNSDLWQIGLQERRKIAAIFTNLIKMGRYRNSLDGNALHYLHDFYSTPEDEDLPWRAFVFASKSTSHEALVDLIAQHHDQKITWKVARRTGLFVWLNDKTALQTQFENVARVEYTQQEDRNPVDCSLYYFALNKKTVLQGLWRRTFGLREKENTLKLLANDFDEPRWRATALKNAYALISKRRFHYAAAFFLLGNSLQDAINVCVNQLNDIQLAIAVARVWDRDLEQSEQVLHNTLEKRVLSTAINYIQGRWMAAWAYEMLGQPAQAIQAIVNPLHQVISTAQRTDFDGPLESMSFRANDPHLTILYTQLRKTLVDQNKWTPDVLTQSQEWSFVIRTASWWSRAGMDYLALRLLREWKFIPHQQLRSAIAPTTLTTSFTDQTTISGNVNGTDEGVGKKEQKKKPAPTQFFEPSADSLLDSFGF